MVDVDHLLQAMRCCLLAVLEARSVFGWTERELARAGIFAQDGVLSAWWTNITVLRSGTRLWWNRPHWEPVVPVGAPNHQEQR